jgi:hypothetical protein
MWRVTQVLLQGVLTVERPVAVLAPNVMSGRVTQVLLQCVRALESLAARGAICIHSRNGFFLCFSLRQSVVFCRI